MDLKEKRSLPYALAENTVVIGSLGESGFGTPMDGCKHRVQLMS